MSLILLVDDEPTVLAALRQPLEKAGHRVTAFEDPGLALEWLSEWKPALVILDVMMPRLSGYEVCRRLRAHRGLRDVPVLFLTSKNRAADMAEAQDAGSQAFLTKPVLAARLLKLVDQHLGCATGSPAR